MKRVHPSEMVYHLWANHAQDEAVNPARNCTFLKYGKIYFAKSYNAIIATSGVHKGKAYALHSTNRWSNTTCRHQMLCRRASSHLVNFTVACVSSDNHYSAGIPHKANLADYAERIREAAFKTVRARSNKQRRINQYQDLVAEANRYAEFFGFKKRFKETLDLDELQKQADQETEKARKRNEAERKKQEERERQAAIKHEENKLRWLAGEDVHYRNCSWSNEPVLLRVRGSRIETSQGAVVEIESAKTLLPFIRAGRAWHRNGQTIKIGDFELDSINEAGDIVIGCHKIGRDELERIAKELNL